MYPLTVLPLLLELFILIDGYDLFCKQNYCPKDRPFCKDYQCLAKCPSNYYSYLNNCISSCPGNLYANGKVCTTQCPISKPYHEKGHCMEMCSDGMVSFNSTCINICPNGTFLIQNKCERTCPSSHFIMLGQKGLVDGGNWKAYPVMMCLDNCPNNTAKVNNSCLTKCPDEQVLLNQSCVDTCPESHQFIAIRRNDMNKIPVCLQECPSNTFVDGRACVSYCPSDKYVENFTCVLNCSEYVPLQCEYLKCNTEPDNTFFFDNSKGKCISKCPDKHIQYNLQCVRFCYQTPLKYLLNDTCVEQCPSNVSYGEDNKCVDECPQNTYLDGNVCTDHCSSNLIPVEGKCYESCPRSHPFQYEFEKRLTYWRTKTMIWCKKACPHNTFSYNFHCVKKCPVNLFTFNESCIRNCPSSHPFSFTGSAGLVSCVDKQPERTFRLNESYFESCPSDNKFVLNGTCFKSCPIDQPYAIEALIFNRPRSVCVESSVNNTLALNKSCVSRCPKDFYIFNGECVQTCPHSAHITYFTSRNYSHPPWNLITHQEDAIFCTRMCYSSKDELAHEISSCLYKSDNRVDLLPKSCSDKSPSSNIEFKLRKCSLKRMYELNNTFFTVCPNRFVYSGKFCASECDAEYQYLAPKTRMCLKACSNQLLKYRNECIEICPTKTRIINTECKDISKCPEHLPISLQRKEGTYCLNECPSKYYLDERTCVDKCNGKKVVNRRCTATCPISHPFEKKSYILNDIPVCYDSCPGNEIGDMQTFKCIDKYECKSYVFDRKCHEKCPDSTFGYKSSTNSEKGCEYIYKIKIAIAFAVILPCLTTVIFVLFVCIEEHTLKEKFTQHMQPWFQRNEAAETYMYHPREHAAGFQIEEVNNEHVEQLAEENTCLLSSDYEMRYFDNQHEEYVQEQPSFDNRR